MRTLNRRLCDLERGAFPSGRPRGPMVHGIMRPGETAAAAAIRIGATAPGRAVLLWGVPS